MDPYRMTDNNNSVSKCYFNFFPGYLIMRAINTFSIDKYIYCPASLIYIQCTAVPALLCIEICTKGCCNFAYENYANLLHVA